MEDQSADQPIRILIVDDHPLVRDGIAALLERQTDMQAVGEAGDGAQAIAKFRDLKPDVTLMDIQMPGVGGVQAIEMIRDEYPAARILVLTTYPGDGQAVSAIRAGATGYLLKNSIRRELLDAIRAVHAGRYAISPAVADEISAHVLDEPLTERELTVLRLVAQGWSNQQIGRQLGLSAETIKAQLKSVFVKLDVHDRTHAATIAWQRGYLDR